MITPDVTKVIFLDIDGVLNSWGSKSHCGIFTGIDRDKTRRLAKIVNETGASIVLSSSWRHDWIPDHKYREHIDIYTAPYVGKYLKNHLWKKGGLTAIDKISRIGEFDTYRDQEILKYLADHPHIKYYVILDDAPFLFDLTNPAIVNHIVLTDDKEGLTDKEAETAIQILSSEGGISDGSRYSSLYC